MKKKCLLLFCIFLTISNLYSQKSIPKTFPFTVGNIDCIVTIDYLYTFKQDGQSVDPSTYLDCSKKVEIILTVKVDIKGRSKNDVEIRFPAGDEKFPAGIKPERVGPPVVLKNGGVGTFSFYCDGDKDEINNRTITIPIWLTTLNGATKLTNLPATSMGFSIKSTFKEEKEIINSIPKLERKIRKTDVSSVTKVKVDIPPSLPPPKQFTEHNKTKDIKIVSIFNKWKQINKKDCAEIIEFISIYKDMNNAELNEAKNIVKKNYELKMKYERKNDSKGVFLLRIYNACKGKIEIEAPNGIKKKQIISSYDDICEYELSAIEHKVVIKAKSFPDGRYDELTIDPSLDTLGAEINLNENTSQVFNIRGGDNEYSIDIQDDNGALLKTYRVMSGNSVVINHSEFKSGIHQIILTDSRKSEFKLLGKFGAARLNHDKI